MPNPDNTDRAPIFPVPRLPRDLPPFWELEQLLSAGYALESALAELGRRREALSAGQSRPALGGQSDVQGDVSGHHDRVIGGAY